MEYKFREIEQKWQQYWAEQKTYEVTEDTTKPKYYVLDMFPYPSGSGLHVGHPLGYIASDIFSRYKRHKGFNVLHPMGFDAFGLPAEQYAIQTGQHPAKTTEENIKRYKEQLTNIGFSFDWTREVRTSDPDYYKWTQWIFLKLFHHWYNNKTNKAEPIDELVFIFEKEGNASVNAAHSKVDPFTAEEWTSMSNTDKEANLQHYRLAYQAHADVNWCPALGTVLANDEVKDGVSERGGHPVFRKSMRQWFLRITAYAQRLLEALDDLDWTHAMKEMQRNWIGRSEGASVMFDIAGHDKQLEIFTTRPDTIYGATFMVLAPEHEWVSEITSEDQATAVADYIDYANKRSDRERLTEAKKITGAFTGTYAVNPFTEEKIPVWIGEYVLSGYGTGAIMAVPAHDARDYDFAKHFNLDIRPVVDGGNTEEGSYDAKDGKMINAGILDGMDVSEAIPVIIAEIEKRGIGSGQVNYKMRDAAFSRQRYWGEPFPVYYREGIPTTLDERDLPLDLPAIETYEPTEDGDAPLARADNWEHDGHPLESDTMPGYAGSSWYFLRYTDPDNTDAFAAADRMEYWGAVDLYLGGAEHATGHLLYARFWTQFLHDLELVPFKEPFKKLINQGMILGENNEKMSKSKHNVVNPDDVIDDFGTDTFRIYEMFLGPIEQHKPWDTQGIDGSSRFLRKFWRLFFESDKADDPLAVVDEDATEEEMKVLHACIKKVNDDVEAFAFNTAISAFMICTNELTSMKCRKRAILEPLVVLISPFAPHMAEELWRLTGHDGTVTQEPYPKADESLLQEDAFEYPVAVNGKVRAKAEYPLGKDHAEIEADVLTLENVQKWLEGKDPRKIIVVEGRMINIVV